MQFFCAKIDLFLFVLPHAFSELILKIEIQRINLIHLAHELDPAVYRILLVTLRMAMPISIKISMNLMVIQHRMRAHYLTRDRAHLAHPCKI